MQKPIAVAINTGIISKRRAQIFAKWVITEAIVRSGSNSIAAYTTKNCAIADRVWIISGADFPSNHKPGVAGRIGNTVPKAALRLAWPHHGSRSEVAHNLSRIDIHSSYHCVLCQVRRVV